MRRIRQEVPVRAGGWGVSPPPPWRASGQGLLLAAISAAFPAAALAVPAATVQFASGNPVAVSASGQSRTLTKGTQLDSGETVNTNNGRVQLRFTDGAYVSLQPQSEFRIDDYRYDGKTDGSERGFFSLLRGGLRTITGLVGRTNKKNYQVTTSVATIGIRGTEYTIAYTNSITGTVGEGEINVCTGTGCVPFGSGQSFIVTDANSRPQLTYQKTDLPPTAPDNPTGLPVPSFIADDVVGSDGLPTFLIAPPVIPRFTGQQTLSVATAVECCTSPTTRVTSGTTVIFDSHGAVQSLNGLSSLATAGNNGILAWGTGMVNPAAAEVTDFVAGTPTPAADLLALKAAPTTLNYVQIGGTALTGNINFGTHRITGPVPTMTLALNTGPMTADVTASGTATAHLAGGATPTFSYQAAVPGIAIGPTTASGSGSFFFSGSGSCTISGGSCSSANFSLLFAGKGASNAGATMYLQGFSTPTGNVQLAGAAVFAKK
jgi:hypothetical protein